MRRNLNAFVLTSIFGSKDDVPESISISMSVDDDSAYTMQTVNSTSINQDHSKTNKIKIPSAHL